MLLKITLSCLMLLGTTAFAQSPDRVRITGDDYVPFYPAKDELTQMVNDFEMDVKPVTNRRFLEFVKTHSKWQRGNIKPLFADTGYLAHWPGTLSVEGIEEQPVIRVSWFAARAYCEAQGGRLPTEHEWEFISRADETRKDATDDLAFNQRVLSFYSKPGGGQIDNVGQKAPNVWGLYDTYGLIWEWVEDFNASIVSSDNRQTGDEQEAKFCGGAALNATNTREYATFMRFAFRSSLKPAFALHNLGFRCAYDVAE